MAQYAIQVNGRRRAVDVEPDTPLLYVLRDTLAINGPKYGCGASPTRSKAAPSRPSAAR